MWEFSDTVEVDDGRGASLGRHWIRFGRRELQSLFLSSIFFFSVLWESFSEKMIFEMCLWEDSVPLVSGFRSGERGVLVSF